MLCVLLHVCAVATVVQRLRSASLPGYLRLSIYCAVLLSYMLPVGEPFAQSLLCVVLSTVYYLLTLLVYCTVCVTTV